MREMNRSTQQTFRMIGRSNMAKRTKNLVDFLDAQLEADPALKSEVEKERLNAAIATRRAS